MSGCHSGSNCERPQEHGFSVVVGWGCGARGRGGRWAVGEGGGWGGGELILP